MILKRGRRLERAACLPGNEGNISLCFPVQHGVLRLLTLFNHFFLHPSIQVLDGLSSSWSCYFKSRSHGV